jgi:hypothetical protein
MTQRAMQEATYRLTPERTRRLAAEAARLQANVGAALARLKPLGVVT